MTDLTNEILADRQRQCTELSERIRSAVNDWSAEQSTPLSLNALLGALAGELGAVLASIENRALADQAMAEFIKAARLVEASVRREPENAQCVLIEMAPPHETKH